MSEPCPCGSGRSFDACCGPVISGAAPAATAEALMRSRYSAYARCAIDHLTESLHPDSRHDHDPEAARRWSQGAQWLGMDILSTEGGGPEDNEGMVEFEAVYKERGVVRHLREASRFVRQDGRWYYLDGQPLPPGTFTRDQPKPGRNDPCPCGSGKKFKKCCGA